MILSFLSHPEIQQLERRIGRRLRKRGATLRKLRGSDHIGFTGYKIVMANSDLCLGGEDYSLSLYAVAYLALAV